MNLGMLISAQESGRSRAVCDPPSGLRRPDWCYGRIPNRRAHSPAAVSAHCLVKFVTNLQSRTELNPVTSSGSQYCMRVPENRVVARGRARDNRQEAAANPSGSPIAPPFVLRGWEVAGSPRRNESRRSPVERSEVSPEGASAAARCIRGGPDPAPTPLMLGPRWMASGRDTQVR